MDKDKVWKIEYMIEGRKGWKKYRVEFYSFEEAMKFSETLGSPIVTNWQILEIRVAAQKG